MKRLIREILDFIAIFVVLGMLFMLLFLYTVPA